MTNTSTSDEAQQGVDVPGTGSTFRVKVYVEELGVSSPRTLSFSKDMSLLNVYDYMQDGARAIATVMGVSMNGVVRLVTRGSADPTVVSSVWSDKIQAIKEMRRLTGMGLKESKDVVEGAMVFIPGVAGEPGHFQGLLYAVCQSSVVELDRIVDYFNNCLPSYIRAWGWHFELTPVRETEFTDITSKKLPTYQVPNF